LASPFLFSLEPIRPIVKGAHYGRPSAPRRFDETWAQASYL
jgi:hypothetical protein